MKEEEDDDHHQAITILRRDTLGRTREGPFSFNLFCIEGCNWATTDSPPSTAYMHGLDVYHASVHVERQVEVPTREPGKRTRTEEQIKQANRACASVLDTTRRR